MLNKLIMQLLGTNPIVTASAKTYQLVVELSASDTQKLQHDLSKNYSYTTVTGGLRYTQGQDNSLTAVTIYFYLIDVGYIVTLERIIPNE